MTNKWNLPDLGFGIGLRTVHYPHILASQPAIDWFEVLSENYLDTGGRPAYVLDTVAERYPVAMHGVSMSVGSTDPIDFGYLAKLKALARRTNARWVSDHLCWTGVMGLNTHDLLPMPYTHEALRHVVSRIRVIQDFLERPLVLENPSTYVEFAASAWKEWDFLCAMAEEADCGLLLDVNNVYVSAYNHGFDPFEYIDKIPAGRVVQIHLAGHTNKGTHIIDTHSDHVISQVWELYRHATNRHSGAAATLIEWDESIPDFDTVHNEALKARAFREEVASSSEVLSMGFDLATTQRWLQAVIMAPGTNEEAIEAESAANEIHPGHARQVVLPSRTLAALERVGVYRSMYEARLRDALEVDYPLLRKFLGDELWIELTGLYLEEHPSRSYTLNRLGDHLPAFIAEIEGLPDTAFVTDLARYELLRTEVFDATETPPLEPDALRDVPKDAWADTRLVPIAAFRLARFRYPMRAYAELAAEQPDAPKPEPQQTRLVIFRRDYQPLALDLTETGCRLLEALAGGQPLGRAIDTAGALDEPLFEWFQTWMSEGLFQRVDLQSGPATSPPSST